LTIKYLFYAYPKKERLMAFLELEKERAILLDRPAWGVNKINTPFVSPKHLYIRQKLGKL